MLTGTGGIGQSRPLQIQSGLLFQTFISPKDVKNQTRIPSVVSNYTSKRWKTRICSNLPGVSTRKCTCGLSIGTYPGSHLSQLVVLHRKLLLFTFVDKSTYVFAVHIALEVEKRTTRRNKPADSPITGFETAPVQRRKRKGNNIGKLPYCFDQCDDSR